MSQNTKHKTQNGFITLMTLLVVAAIGVAVTTTLLLRAVGDSQSSFTTVQSAQANALANACAEVGLQQIHTTVNFTGTATLTIGAGSCTYTVTSLGGAVRQIIASGTVGTNIRRMRLTTTAVRPVITLSEWQEVAN